MSKKVVMPKVDAKVQDTRDARPVVGTVIAVTEQSILIRFGKDDSIYEREDARFLKAVKLTKAAKVAAAEQLAWLAKNDYRNR